MGIVTAILNALKKAFKGKPATVSELKKTMTSLGLDDPKIMDEVIAAYKAEETASLSKAKDLVAKGDVPEELAKPVVQTFDDSIKKFADEIGGDVDEVKGAIANYVNEGYEAGSYKRVDPDSAESIEANPSKFLQEMFNVEPTKVQKIADSTLAELQAMDAQLKNLLEEGKFTEADALAERLKDFRNQLNAGDLDAAVIPPDRTLNANGGLIPPSRGPMANGIGQMFKQRK